MNRALRTLAAAVLAFAVIGLLVLWVLLGMFLVSIGRDGWAMVQLLLTVLLVMWGIIAALDAGDLSTREKSTTHIPGIK